MSRAWEPYERTSLYVMFSHKVQINLGQVNGAFNRLPGLIHICILLFSVVNIIQYLAQQYVDIVCVIPVGVVEVCVHFAATI